MRAAGLVFAALLGQSFFWSPANPFTLKAVVAGSALLAAFKPRAGLLALAAAVPFGRLISTLMSPGAPVGITEALALACLRDGPGVVFVGPPPMGSLRRDSFPVTCSRRSW